MKTKIKFLDLELKNPIIAASGTFGFGEEYAEHYDIEKLGGISYKGLTLDPRDGNDGIRVWETPAGMMNSVGLENPGVDAFARKIWPRIQDRNLISVVNLGGSTLETYLEGIRRLEHCDYDILELNISCPNVKAGGMAFGTEAKSAERITRAVRMTTQKRLMVKLSPNVGNIGEIAKACQAGGADAISLINTVQAMAIDTKSREIVFNNTYAGLSGPAIRPIALRMVHQTAKAVNIPIVGMGGISNADEVIQFLMAGASAVQIGTAFFTNPDQIFQIPTELEMWMEKEGVQSLEEIIGIV
ncbi:dihydroorotate dehydrogenase [Gottschalkiaceae bacterium SANA]|nr:dihydroorotate dehydrogenase [Gottschalkiaceae bacterium SANA]